jgi:hypothetical protein
MPAAPPTAQPRSDATNFASQHGHAHGAGESNNVWQHTGFEPMSVKQKAVYNAKQSAKYTEDRLQWEERQQLVVGGERAGSGQGTRSSGPAPNANRTGAF